MGFRELCRVSLRQFREQWRWGSWHIYFCVISNYLRSMNCLGRIPLNSCLEHPPPAMHFTHFYGRKKLIINMARKVTPLSDSNILF